MSFYEILLLGDYPLTQELIFNLEVKHSFIPREILDYIGVEKPI